MISTGWILHFLLKLEHEVFVKMRLVKDFHLIGRILFCLSYKSGTEKTNGTHWTEMVYGGSRVCGAETIKGAHRRRQDGRKTVLCFS